MKDAGETYLGDGLYARLENASVWLRAPRDGGDHEVCLEPEVFIALLAWLTRADPALSAGLHSEARSRSGA